MKKFILTPSGKRLINETPDMAWNFRHIDRNFAMHVSLKNYKDAAEHFKTLSSDKQQAIHQKVSELAHPDNNVLGAGALRDALPSMSKRYKDWPHVNAVLKQFNLHSHNENDEIHHTGVYKVNDDLENSLKTRYQGSHDSINDAEILGIKLRTNHRVACARSHKEALDDGLTPGTQEYKEHTMDAYFDHFDHQNHLDKIPREVSHEMSAHATDWHPLKW